MKCNMDCFNCIYADCIRDYDEDVKERQKQERY